MKDVDRFAPLVRFPFSIDCAAPLVPRRRAGSLIPPVGHAIFAGVQFRFFALAADPAVDGESPVIRRSVLFQVKPDTDCSVGHLVKHVI